MSIQGVLAIVSHEIHASGVHFQLWSDLPDGKGWYTTMTCTYYIDGQMVGSHVPVNAKELKKGLFQLVIGVCGGKVAGYITHYHPCSG